MDELTGAVTIKGENIPPKVAVEIEQYLNDDVAQALFEKYNASLRVHLTYSEVSATRS